MKKLMLFIVFEVALQMGYAQQKPHYTQYVLNNYIVNPALSGIENYVDIKLSARDQWVGLNGAPKTSYITIQGPIGKKDLKTSATSFEIPGGNPRGEAYWETYTASEPHHGAGVTLVHDRTGNFNHLSAIATYAYHLGLSPTLNLASGFGVGISQVRRDFAKTDFGNGVNMDPAQTVNNKSHTKADVSAGLWLYGKTFFAGLSAQQIVPQSRHFGEITAPVTGRTIPHLFATAGYRFLLNDDINALPSIMIKYINGTPTKPQFDVNIKLQYHDLFWTGGSYRLKDGYAAMFGLNVSNTFNVGYSYDFTTTALRTASKGTHELVIGFMIGNRYADTCPRNVW